MGKKPEEYFCDVCKDPILKGSKTEIQVIFTTEQTEGRGVPNYLSDESIDMCKKCHDHVLKGNYLFGHGAQGYNNYFFNNKRST